jgi:hypothetical protein
MKKLLGLIEVLTLAHRLAVIALAIGMLSSGTAFAQQGFGLRGGLSLDPDQFYFGGHYVTAPLAGKVRFQPNLELGIGDDLTTIALNFEFAYWARLNRDWQIYGGGGPAMNLFEYEGRDEGDAEAGFNILVGFRQKNGLFFEMKVGALDSPDVKFGVGYTFGPG